MTQATAQYPSLAGRTVCITGGGSGIGAALTRAFHLQGAQVAFIDIARAPSERLVAELKEETGRAPWFQECDLRDLAALKRTLGDMSAQLGAIRVLVNNAACDDRHAWREVKPDQWDDLMAVNLRPMFFASQTVVPQMAAAGGGSIINFGSISVRMALGNMAAYVSAKAAAHGLTRGLARDLGASGIRVNTVVPGCIMTERQLAKWISPEDERRIQEHQCLKVRLLPEHVAPIVLFLASDDSAQLTGQAFPVDGGYA